MDRPPKSSGSWCHNDRPSQFQEFASLEGLCRAGEKLCGLSVCQVLRPLLDAQAGARDLPSNLELVVLVKAIDLVLLDQVL